MTVRALAGGGVEARCRAGTIILAADGTPVAGSCPQGHPAYDELLRAARQYLGVN